MPEEMRPASNKEAPDPAVTYERADPHRESGMGAMQSPKPKEQKTGDKMEQSVSNNHSGKHQINGQETINERGGPVSGQPDHSMHDEEPLGSDQRPIEHENDKNRRFPRTGGQGGTPDAGEKTSKG